MGGKEAMLDPPTFPRNPGRRLHAGTRQHATLAQCMQRPRRRFETGRTRTRSAFPSRCSSRQARREIVAESSSPMRCMSLRVLRNAHGP